MWWCSDERPVSSSTPRVRRRRRLSLIVSIIALLADRRRPRLGRRDARRPARVGGITLPGYFDAEPLGHLHRPARCGRLIGGGVSARCRPRPTAAVCAIVLGIVLSLLRSSDARGVRIPTTVVLEFLRGMPVLLMMLFILLRVSTGAFWAVVVALVLYNGALIGEMLRAGLASLPRGQREAGSASACASSSRRCSSSSRRRSAQMLPIIVAQLVVLLKDTSLGYIVGYIELIRREHEQARRASTATGTSFSLFLVTLVHVPDHEPDAVVVRPLAVRARPARRGRRLDRWTPVRPLGRRRRPQRGRRSQ